MVLKLTPHWKQGVDLSMQYEATAWPLGIKCRMSCLISANFVSVTSRNLQLDTSWHVNQYRASNSFDSVFLSSRGAHASVYPAIMKDIQVLNFKAGIIVHQVYFMNHRYDGVQLWDVRTIFGVRELVWAMSFISFFFLYPSTFNLLEVAAVDKPKLHMWETGIMRITRHPQV